jgi:hypothetical protein
LRSAITTLRNQDGTQLAFHGSLFAVRFGQESSASLHQILSAANQGFEAAIPLLQLFPFVPELLGGGRQVDGFGGLDFLYQLR